MQAKILFLLKFLVLVAILLPLWVFVAAEWYMVVLGEESAITLRILGYAILDVAATKTGMDFQLDSVTWKHFEAINVTLSLVVFVALLLSTPKVAWRRRLGFLALGIVSLNLFHVLYVDIHFWVNFSYGPGSPALGTLQSVSEVLCLLLPMLLWALMEAPRLFRSRRPARRAVQAT